MDTRIGWLVATWGLPVAIVVAAVLIPTGHHDTGSILGAVLGTLGALAIHDGFKTARAETALSEEP